MLYPTITQSREVVDLNGIWEFNFPDSPKSLLYVPASFNDQLGTHEAKHYVGDMYYQREFLVTQAMLEKRIFLRFGAVAHVATVYVNDQEVGSHKGGFLPFEFEVNKFVKVGNNKLVVKVSNILDRTSLPVGNYKEEVRADGKLVKKVDENFDFFNYAGIIRPVKLLVRPQTYLEDVVITYEVTNLDAKVNFALEVNGTFANAQVTVFDEAGNEVIQASGTDNVSLVVKNYTRWHVLESYLYKAQIRLFDAQGNLLDEYFEDFGIRTIEVKGTQFLLNGEPVYFKGFGKHEDTYLNGRGINEVANVSDIQRMKWIGANSFRTSHYPYSEEMMRLADREGFLVIDETTAVGLFENFGFTLVPQSQVKNTWEVMDTDEAHEQVIRELIKRDKNHACVVMWSIANEPATQDEGAYEYFKPKFDLARELDPQKRPCTLVNITMAPAGKCLASKLSDVICLNRYYGWYTELGDLELAEYNMRKELEYWHELFPDRPVMFTEYGADTVAGFHDFDERTPFTEEYQVLYYKMNERVFDSYDWFIGEQTWNFADFQTKFGIFRVQGNKKGVFTRERNPKMVAHHLQERWNSIPNTGYKK